MGVALGGVGEAEASDEEVRTLRLAAPSVENVALRQQVETTGVATVDVETAAQVAYAPPPPNFHRAVIPPST